jgi:hypothetical protein
MKGKIRRPSPALIVAVVALIAALTGTAIALPGARSVDRNDLKKNTVGPKQLRANSVGNSEMALLKVGQLTKATAAASQAAAPALVLYSRDALQVYAKCFVDATDVRGEIYLRTTAPGAIFESDEDDEEGDGAEPLDGYVNPGEDEEEHELSVATAGVNLADESDDDQFMAVQGNTAIHGIVGAFAKQGVLPAGDGPYGAGNRCLFHGFFAGIG